MATLLSDYVSYYWFNVLVCRYLGLSKIQMTKYDGVIPDHLYGISETDIHIFFITLVYVKSYKKSINPVFFLLRLINNRL